MESADKDFQDMLCFIVTAGKLRTAETDDLDDRAALDRAASRYAAEGRRLLNAWTDGLGVAAPTLPQTD